jgi:cell division ATPase FtsA
MALFHLLVRECLVRYSGCNQHCENLVPKILFKEANVWSLPNEVFPDSSYKDLCNIIRARMEELLQLILMEMPPSDYHALAPCGLVLTGGTANLPGLDELGQQILRIPVRKADL